MPHVVHASLAPSRQTGAAPDLCWREVVHMALGGWRPAKALADTLIDCVEGVR